MTSAHSEATHASSHGHADAGHTGAGHTVHPPEYYIRTWAILVALLVVSVVGPMLGNPALTLLTAFGIALVKAFLVATRFMHLNAEKKFVNQLLLTCIALMLLMFGAVAPDVMKHNGAIITVEGQGVPQWDNRAAKAAIERGLAAHPESAHGEHGEHGEAAHGDAHH